MADRAPSEAEGSGAVEESARVESGPVRIGDDWAGVFIRGDHAFHFAMEVDRAVGFRETEGQGEDIAEILHVAALKGLADTLRSCREPCEAVALRRADTAPPIAKSPASPSTLAARSEPERRAEIESELLLAGLARQVLAALWELPGYHHTEGHSVVEDIRDLATRLSEPRYTRAEAPAERTLAEMYADEFSKALSRLSTALWAHEEDDGPAPSADEIVDEAIRRLAARAEERSHG